MRPAPLSSWPRYRRWPTFRFTDSVTASVVTPSAATRSGSTATVTWRPAPPPVVAWLTPETEANRGATRSSTRSCSALRSSPPGPSTWTIIAKLASSEVSNDDTTTRVPRGCARCRAAAMRCSSSSRTLRSAPGSKRTW